MRNLLALAAAAVLTFAGLGWYLDWYHIRVSPGTPTGHQNVNIDINGAKVLDDTQKGVKKGEERLHEVLEKNRADGSGLHAGALEDSARAQLPALHKPEAPRIDNSGLTFPQVQTPSLPNDFRELLPAGAPTMPQVQMPVFSPGNESGMAGSGVGQ